LSVSADVNTFSFLSLDTQVVLAIYFIMHSYTSHLFFSCRQLVLLSVDLVVSLTGVAAVLSGFSRYPLNKTCHHTKQRIVSLSISHLVPIPFEHHYTVYSSDEATLQFIKMFL